MQTKDWQVVKDAKKAAEYQLAYYRKMMSTKNANQETETKESFSSVMHKA
jgi:hypothetical protein